MALNSPLEVSGIACFATVALWLLLRGGVFAWDLAFPRKTRPSYPVSAQRMGFAQWIGEWSPIVSEEEYAAKLSGMGVVRRLARTWSPMAAFIGVIQFLMFFGAKGLEAELGVSYQTALLITFSALGLLGLFKKDAITDHFRKTFLSEGRALDWDDESHIGGVRARVRLDSMPKRVSLTRVEDSAIGKDGKVFVRKGMAATPDSVHWHGAGIICSEYRSLDSMDDAMDLATWAEKTRMRDVFHAIISAYAVAGEERVPVCAILEYPGAKIHLYPLAEHLEFFCEVAERLKKRKRIPTISAKEVANAAYQEFPSRFDKDRITGLLARDGWISKREMPL